MAGSILTDTKKILGISEADTSFDLDVMTHINTAFSVLHQLGVGPEEGFMIESKSEEWDEFEVDDILTFNMVRTYIGLKVKMFFDPPSTSFLLDSMDKQIQQLESRLNTEREWQLDPVDPMSA